jgi:hypothetical protein
MPRLAEGKEGSSYMPATGSCQNACGGAFLVIFVNILMLEPFQICYASPYRSSEVPLGFPAIFPTWRIRV